MESETSLKIPFCENLQLTFLVVVHKCTLKSGMLFRRHGKKGQNYFYKNLHAHFSTILHEPALTMKSLHVRKTIFMGEVKIASTKTCISRNGMFSYHYE